MMLPTEAGARVRIRATILQPGGRAPGVPRDTADIPYEVRMCGELIEAARPGEPVEIITGTGRRMRGLLEEVDPPDPLASVAPPAALVRMRSAIDELRNTLWDPS